MTISNKTKRWSALAAGVFALGGGGVGMALAGSNGTPAQAPVQSAPGITAGQVQGTMPAQPAETPSAADPVGNPQMEGPDAATEPAESATENTAAENTAAENAPETSEPNEPALPGGGHQDPAGQNVDHQFEGVE